MTGAPRPTEVVLVRHASTSWSGRRYCGMSDPPLDDAGRRQAMDLAAGLIPTVPDDARLISSPSRRAVETAAAIATALGHDPAQVEIDARWSEADFGVAEGLTFDELSAIAPVLATRLADGTVAIDWPGGETAAALAARVAAAWRDLVADGRPAVVVSHAGPLRLAIGLADGCPPDRVEVPTPAGARRRTLGVPPSRA